jgi:hypothetical protein
MLCAALLRHEGCPQRGVGPLGRRFITGMSGRFLSTVHFPDSNRPQFASDRAQRKEPRQGDLSVCLARGVHREEGLVRNSPASPVGSGTTQTQCHLQPLARQSTSRARQDSRVRCAGTSEALPGPSYGGGLGIPTRLIARGMMAWWMVRRLMIKGSPSGLKLPGDGERDPHSGRPAERIEREGKFAGSSACPAKGHALSVWCLGQATPRCRLESTRRTSWGTSR